MIVSFESRVPKFSSELIVKVYGSRLGFVDLTLCRYLEAIH